MRPCTLCEKHKVESTHKLGLGGFQTLRNAAAANGVQLNKNTTGEYIIEKILKTNKDKIYVKWRGYSNNFNSWIDKNSVTKYI